MYALAEQPAQFDEINRRSKSILSEIISKLPIRGSEQRLAAQQNIFSNRNTAGRLFILKDGILSCRVGNGPIIAYEPGDLVGLFNIYHPGVTSIWSDFAVVVDEFQSSEFLDAIWGNLKATKLWNEYVGCQLNLLAIMVGSLTRCQDELIPTIKNFEKGDVVIRQGDKSSEVFTLIEGSLEVSVDGVKVGEVLRDEIFGALAAAADTFRTATVVARERSIVVSVPKEGFLSIIETRPATTLKLIQDMARSIVALNKTVVKLS